MTHSAQQEAEPEETVVLRDSSIIPVADSPVLGNADAPITIVVFAGFQCPFSQNGVARAIHLQEKYPRDIRIVFKHLPLPMHPQAMAASHAAIAAGKQGKFWQMHDWLFDHQSEFREHDSTMKSWTSGHARELGLDVAKFEKDFDDATTAEILKRDLTLAQKLKLRGTPIFFINGELMMGAPPLTKFEEIVTRQLQETEELRRAGVAPEDIYVRMAEDHFDGDTYDDIPPSKPAPAATYVPTEADEPGFGNTDDPLVTIVVFSDFQCPFCKRSAQTIEQIRDKYGDKIHFVFKQLPLHSLHPQAREAARAALAAHQQGKFWQMHDLLFEHQDEFREHSDDFEVFARSLAKSLALDVDKFESDYESDAVYAKVSRDEKLAEKIGAKGTPNFWINGVNLTGAQPFFTFEELIDEQLTLAQKLKDEEGLSGDALYKAAVEQNETRVKDKTEYLGDIIDMALFDLEHAPSRGPAGAPVSIIVFSDFECPFCQRGHVALQQAMARHDGEVRLVHKNMPLYMHRAARPAALAALAAGEQGKFWQMHDLLFERQKELKNDGIFEQLAAELGLDMPRFQTALEDPELNKRVDRDLNEGKKFGVRGTPAFFINGKRITGAKTTEEFNKLIEEALADVNADKSAR